ncbi:MAG: glycosyltransferase [Chloracidobacterium sp.]|nr:glycosyltransferase [Chloracidobacterium sp.]MDW8216461.1 glycosyltransferase [Acidobacteriota bacterium]
MTDVAAVHWFDLLLLPLLGRALLRLWEGRRLLHYVRRFVAARAHPKPYAPFVTVILPCKGDDEGLRRSLPTLATLDFPRYEIVFVVESEADAAWPRLTSFAQRHPDRLRVVVAGLATDSGQKVHNLLAGVRAARPESEVFAFLDSDIEVARDWLRELVAPLGDEQVGATSGMRWYSLADADLPSLWRANWNTVILTNLNPAGASFVWGGSMALRRTTFEQLRLAERWRGTLSDDYTLSAVLREQRRRMVFVPTCLVASPDRVGWRDLWEFTMRQIIITRVYHPTMWRIALLWYGFLTVVVAGVFLESLGDGLAGRLSTAHLGCALLVLLGALDDAYALTAVKAVLGAHHIGDRRRRLLFCLLHLPTAMLYAANTAASLFRRVVVWRGVAYRLVSAQRTEILGRTSSGVPTNHK